MAYNEFLQDRIVQTLNSRGIKFYEKNMFGGLTFMVDDKMCVGIIKNEMMARIHPDNVAEALQKEGCKRMVFTGRPMKGFVMIEPIGYDMDEDLDYFIQLALDYNSLTKSSKKEI
ncbi:MAG: TfoX/Sxy family protein [Salinivirgaceae bacterium]|nr:TfoX/Sxy family protein [Salinivirgaceae bacterium]